MNIAIASGKGGTGKTTISTNLSLYLSKNQQVILADLDVEEPNSGLFVSGELVEEQIKYNMVPSWQPAKCTLCGDCQNNCEFNAVVKIGQQILVYPQLCHSCYACSELCPEQALPMVGNRMGVTKYFVNNNLHFIESKLDIGQEMAVPIISQTIKYINSNFDKNILRIFDSPPGTSCPVIEVAQNSDFVILVTEPTPFGLNDLILAVETMQELKKKFAVVINRFGIGNQEVEKYCQENNIDIIAKIPNNRKIAELYSQGKTLYDKIPDFAKELQKITDYIFQEKFNKK
jgi:MinD superfamily P-loop ATPase